MKKALFLDRDGTLIVDKDYLKDPKDVELFPGIAEFLMEALAKGYMLFLFTNQSGVSRGYYKLEDAHACNARMMELLGLPEPGFVEVGIAIEGPDADPGEEVKIYRKPSPRFILEMVEKYDLDKDGCWMIGDKLSDLEAGIRAGIKSAWVASGKSKDGKLDEFIMRHGIAEFGSLREFILN
ncbi:MAG: hypothetical protein C5B43_01790 [Verrucomicrobia bacterium]|nr:MAG: hypothetical protein C5B43_01790 [Verrucomicrobiota bacterium]